MKLEDQEWVINPNTGNKINMKKQLTEMQLALIYIDSNFPFFSSLVRRLKFMWSFQPRTACTDGTRMLFNPEFMSKQTIRMKAFVIMHEVMHCALDHLARGKNHDHTKSNIAADYEVNGLLVSDNVVSADDMKPYYYSPKYERIAYEAIYAQCENGTPPPPQQGGQDGSGNEGDKNQNQNNNGNGQGNADNTPKSPDWVSGWNKAMEDYKNGKIKLT